MDHMDVSIFILGVNMAAVLPLLYARTLNPDKIPVSELNKKSQYFVGLLKHALVANNSL